ncbi:MAG: clostripain-related cysteine peptidase [Bacteroidales bacterium]|nr:clostripain-related cysteine peptidase [Bacteroidales bacterium]
MMKSNYLHTIIGCLLIFTTAMLSSCIVDEQVAVKRTVIIYVSAQNTLTTWMKRDSTEIWEGAKRMENGQKLVVFMDTRERPAIYVLTNKTGNTAPVAYQFSGKVDSSDPRTLSTVIAWAKANAANDEYALVLGSHGDGWLPSLNTDYEGVTSGQSGIHRWAGHKRPASWGIDSERSYSDSKVGNKYGTQMNIADLAAAIEQTGTKLKYLFFDACLMQGLEVAYDMRRVAEYMIGSPMYIPAAGAYYTNMVPKGLFAAHPVEIAKQYIADATDAKNPYADNYSTVGMVISVIDLNYMDELATATYAALAHSSLAGISPDLTGVQSYLAFRGYPFFHDAGMSMSCLVSPDSYRAWRSVFDRVVVYKAATKRFIANASSNLYYAVQDGYTGVSMFVPQEYYNTSASASSWGNHNVNFKATHWYAVSGWKQAGW